QIPGRFLAITMPGDNPLRRLAEKYGFPALEHHPQIGGRFSVLSNVGLLPAALAGLDPAAFRSGAKEVVDSLLHAAIPADHAPALGAAVNIALAEDKGASQAVLMPYTDRLFLFAFWYRQLWAESLGKDGKGTTPINALGPVDQHSQVQLYLSGPADKFYTIVMTDCAGQGPVVPSALVDNPALVYLSDKRIGDLQDAEQRATADTLINNNRPTRIIKVPTLSAEALGALMMHFMLETIFAAHLLGVDPYDQPAVEEGKILARKYLGEL
ncbi:MAG: glucose-6-phosphate isomerase, partial [Pseudomonadota bacterium]